MFGHMLLGQKTGRSAQVAFALVCLRTLPSAAPVMEMSISYFYCTALCPPTGGVSN